MANCEYVLASSLRGSVSEANTTKQSTNKNMDCHESAIADSRNDEISPSLAESNIGGGYIIDYRKSRKLIKELNKECDKPITLNMSGYRAEFDIFQTIANLMGWKIKRLFLDKSTHPQTPLRKGRGNKRQSLRK